MPIALGWQSKWARTCFVAGRQAEAFQAMDRALSIAGTFGGNDRVLLLQDQLADFRAALRPPGQFR